MYLFYYTSEYGIEFLILENIQKHTLIMLLPCLVKHIGTFTNFSTAVAATLDFSIVMAYDGFFNFYG